MKTLLMFIFIGLFSGCEFEALDSLERLANSNFCPGAQREEDGKCPTPSIRAGWTFEDSNDFIFDKNKVQFSKGSAKLASIDFLKSESDFLEGSHYGTHYDEASKTLALKTKLHSDFDVRNILSDKTQFLEGYWKFENNPNDSSSKGLNSTNLGTPYFSNHSKVGAYSLTDGVGADGVNVSNTPHFDKFSVSTWFYINSSQSWRMVFIKGGDTSNRDWYLISNASGEYGFFLENTCSVDYKKYPTQSWNHLMVSVGDGSVNVYINGELIDSKPCSSPPENKGSNLTLGANLDGTSAFDGYLDDFSLWSTALSIDDAKKIYNAQKLNYSEHAQEWTPKWSEIVGYWNFNGDYKDQGPNSYDGNVSGNTSLSEGHLLDKALSLDGVDSQLNVAGIDADLNRDSGSLSCWIYNEIPDGDSQNRFLFRYFVSTSNEISARFLSSGEFQYRYVGGGVARVADTSNWEKTIPRNAWTHLTMTWDVTDSSNISLYLNGKLVSSQTQSSLMSSGASTFFRFGYGTNGFKGRLNECALWGDNLNAAEVFEIYERQKYAESGLYVSPVIDLGIPGVWDTLSITTPIPYAKPLSPASEVGNYVEVAGDLANGLIGHWGFDETSYNSTSDSKDFEDKINGNNLSEGGVAQINQEGVVGNAVNLDGVNDYLVAADHDSLDLQSSVTLSVWMKSNGNLADTNEYGGLVAKSSFSGTVTYGIRIFNSSYEFLVRQTDGQYKRSRKNTTPKIVDGKWHHLVGIADATNGEVKVYIDGVLQTDSIDSTFDGTIARSLQNLNFGKDYGGTHFNGKLDEVAIWDRPLSDAEVAQLYQRGANNLKIQVRSCANSDCSDGEWIGPEGSGESYFSEFYNNDSISNIGLPNGMVSPTGMAFNYSDYVTAPTANRYFQYRAFASIQESSNCATSECLPRVSSIKLGTGDVVYADYASITPKNPIDITKLKSISVESTGTCDLGFQASLDGSNYYYWDGTEWKLAINNTISTLKNDLEKLKELPGIENSQLYLKTIMKSDSNQNCSIKNISIKNYI